MNKLKKGKSGNILTFLRDNWYTVSCVLLTTVSIVLIIILFFQKKSTSSNFQNEIQKNNNENYITDVIVTSNKCPDGYWNAIGNDPIQILKDNTNVQKKTEMKLCYKIPDQITNTDLIVTDLNLNFNSQKCIDVNGIDCNNEEQVFCNLNTTPSSTPNTTPNIANLQCRCQNCGDVPVGHFSQNGINVNCAGVINKENIKQTLCSSQNIYNPNKSNQGITDIYLSDGTFTCSDDYQRINNTNICVLKN